jgi:hypothetical protein
MFIDKHSHPFVAHLVVDMKLLIFIRVDADLGAYFCAPGIPLWYMEDFVIESIQRPIARGEILINTVDCCVRCNRSFPVVAAHSVPCRRSAQLFLGPPTGP